MNTMLNKLQEKYTPVDQVPVPKNNQPARVDETDRCAFKPGAAGWRGCASICMLRAYLADHPGLGARVGLDEKEAGVLVLRFNPAVDPDDDERMGEVRTVIELLQDAKDDILQLVGLGAMRLKTFNDK